MANQPATPAPITLTRIVSGVERNFSDVGRIRSIKPGKCRPAKLGREAIKGPDDFPRRAADRAQSERAFFDAILRNLADKLLASFAGRLLQDFLDCRPPAHFSQLAHALLAGLLEDLLDGVFDDFARDGNLCPRGSGNERNRNQKCEDWRARGMGGSPMSGVASQKK